jgi:hypothetical protein
MKDNIFFARIERGLYTQLLPDLLAEQKADSPSIRIGCIVVFCSEGKIMASSTVHEDARDEGVKEFLIEPRDPEKT